VGNVAGRIVQEIKIHFVLNKFCFRISYVYEIMRENVVWPDRAQVAILCGAQVAIWCGAQVAIWCGLTGHRWQYGVV